MSHLSPKQAAQALGVSESSVKRWCDLGAVPVLRTAGGHRRIPRQCLDKLLAQGGLAQFESLEKAPQFVDEATSTTAGVDIFAKLDQHREAFRVALQAGREGECQQLLQQLIASGLPLYAAADLLVTDAMHQFGHLWQNGDLAVYQERRACGICLGLLHDLKKSIPPHADGPVAIGGSPRGDFYQLPTQLVELALCELGWQATSLGSNLPIDSIGEAYREYRPKMLWMSLSLVEDEDAFVSDFNRLADMLSPDTMLLVGGRAASDSLRPRLRYTAHCDSLQHLRELAIAIQS